MHTHSAADECTPACTAYNPNGWRCSLCRRQVPMLADTEDLAEPLCVECFGARFELFQWIMDRFEPYRPASVLGPPRAYER